MWSYYIERIRERELEKFKEKIKYNKDVIVKKEKKMVRIESWDTFVKIHLPWIL